MKKLLIALLVAVPMVSFAQSVNPADLAERFMLCNDQSQTQQVMVMLDEMDAPKGATFMRTDAPGSRNIQEMLQLNVVSASYDQNQITIEAEGMTDPKVFSISAQSIGEHNITPTLKTTVYTGQMQGDVSAQVMCLVLDAEELAEIAPAS